MNSIVEFESGEALGRSEKRILSVFSNQIEPVSGEVPLINRGIKFDNYIQRNGFCWYQGSAAFTILVPI